MKKLITLSFLSLFLISTGALTAQNKKKDKKSEVYSFTLHKENPYTSVKNQFRSSTCWSFSVISFFESELLRMGKGEWDLSEMFVVYNAFVGKAEKYYRLHGNTYFPVGGASNDVNTVWEEIGIVPESVYTGIQYNEDKHEHAELDRLLSGFMKALVHGDKVSGVWRKAYKGILDTYLGAIPENFEYEGKTYTAREFADELGLQMKDYIKLSSFTHQPFYTNYIMDVPDNWNGGMVNNLPLDELFETVKYALENGHTVAWGGDVSEKGFSWKNGVAIIPDENAADLQGTDRDKWESMSSKERVNEAYKFEKIIQEKVITQEERQKGYDNYSSTDDHGMHIVGLASDQNGTLYFKVKNSWDIDNPYKGFIYMSESYFRSKTLDIMLHKDAIPASIKAKLSL